MKTYKDVFVEELVVRQRPLMVALLKVAAVLLGIVLTVAFYFVTGMFLGEFGSAVFPVLFALVCIGVFLAFRFLGLEYEYSFYSGEIDIDRIIGKRKRSTLLSFNCRDIELMTPYSESCDPLIGDAKLIDARGSGAGQRDWIVIVKSETGEKTVLAFSPSDRMLDAFRQYVRGGKFKEE